MMSINEAIVILDNSNIVYSQLLMEPYQTLKTTVLAQQTTTNKVRHHCALPVIVAALYWHTTAVQNKIALTREI